MSKTGLRQIDHIQKLIMRPKQDFLLVQNQGLNLGIPGLAFFNPEIPGLEKN